MSTCYSPMKAHKDAEGNIKFNSNGSEHTLSLPCGQCIGCRLNHAEGWAIRMVHEAQMHEENAFLTLTYAPEHLPPDGSLRYEDVTKFIKRLRKVLNKTKYKIKYYRVGEYGENFSRPHYHVILFGFDFSAQIRYRGELNCRELWRTKGEHKYYISNLLTKLWGLGHAEIGDVNYRTCMYVAKYVTKKVNGRNKSEHYQRIDQFGEMTPVLPEQASMSRKNAIGKQWLEQFWEDVYPHDHCVHDTKKLKVPKYYDKWLEKNNPALLDQIKQAREESAVQLSQDDLTRKYNTKVLTQKNFVREYDGTNTTNHLDQKILEYRKNEAMSLHLQRKGKC